MPAPGVVFGCLLPVPWVGAAAGLLLALGPAAGLPDRFAPLTLALVHALTVGTLLPVMLGALVRLLKGWLVAVQLILFPLSAPARGAVNTCIPSGKGLGEGMVTLTDLSFCRANSRPKASLAAK